MCDCQPRLIADKFITKKNSKNYGRYFYTCKRPKTKECGFFLWEDDAVAREPNTPRGVDPPQSVSKQTKLEYFGRYHRKDAHAAKLQQPEQSPSRSSAHAPTDRPRHHPRQPPPETPRKTIKTHYGDTPSKKIQRELKDMNFDDDDDDDDDPFAPPAPSLKPKMLFPGHGLPSPEVTSASKIGIQASPSIGDATKAGDLANEFFKRWNRLTWSRVQQPKKHSTKCAPVNRRNGMALKREEISRELRSRAKTKG